MQRLGGGTDAQGLVGHVRQSSLHPARGGKPRGAFRQVDDVIDTNMLAYKPMHAPDTSVFSPTHISRSCQAAHLHPHPRSCTHPVAPAGSTAENPVPAPSKSVRHSPQLLVDFVEQRPLIQPFAHSTFAQMCMCPLPTTSTVCRVITLPCTWKVAPSLGSTFIHVISLNSPSSPAWRNYQHHFTAEETEAQRGEVTLPRPHS